jgi:hypothetical protein
VKSTDLLIWGVVVHLLIDWLGQNEWMAVNKAKRRSWPDVLRVVDPKTKKPLPEYGEEIAVTVIGDWWDRHPAAYAHAALHGAAQLLIFPWPAALAIGITHLLIDTRWPVAAWSKLIRQTQPDPTRFPVMDIGADVRIWADQVWHIGVIALLALVSV